MAGHVVVVVLGILLLVAMLTLHAICLSLPYYSEATNLGKAFSNKADLDSYKAYYPRMNAQYGFWKMCFNVYDRDTCYFFGLEEDANSNTIKAPDWLIACQAVSIIGLIVGAMGVLLSFIWLRVLSTQLLVAGSVCAIIGGLIIIVPDIVFSIEKSSKFVFQNSQMAPIFGSPEVVYLVAVDNSFQYSWNFGLDLATGIACVLIGALFALCASVIQSDQLNISKDIF